MERARHRVHRHRLAAAVAGLVLLGWPAWRSAAPLPVPVAPVQRQPIALSPPAFERSAWAMPRAPRVRLETDTPWAGLLAAAATDDPVAACRLAALVEECRLARDVEAMIDTALRMAASESSLSAGGPDPPQVQAEDILRLEDSAAAARAACGSAPPELVWHGWSFVWRAALAGHEPSMLRFVTDLPLDPSHPHEHAAALATWRAHAPGVLASLLRRRVPAALPIAYRAAQGLPVFGSHALQRRDPAAVVRIGTALARVHGEDAALAVELAVLDHELDAGARHRAQAEGERLAEGFSPAQALESARDDDCSAGWPGAASNATAIAAAPGAAD